MMNDLIYALGFDLAYDYSTLYVALTISNELKMYIVTHFVQDWSGQNVSSIASEICGFITVLSGTIILHATREQEPPPLGKYMPFL